MNKEARLRGPTSSVAAVSEGGRFGFATAINNPERLYFSVIVLGEFRRSNLPVTRNNVESPTLTRGCESKNTIPHIPPDIGKFFDHF